MWFKKKVIKIQEKPYFDDWGLEEQNDFLGKVKELFNNETLHLIITHLAKTHFDKAGIETKNWEETLAERSIGAGNVEIEQELERLNFEYEQRIEEQKKIGD